ncbi:ubiquinone biosynthesis protein UbiA [Occultella glacieicola]|uniref:Ubiquinone biosynthesis protein UbiA n=1 Tax=Occultella glacieicola TaxID=2518684 RepID=A0ABY2E5Z8_9MICO|nr:UbiA family prenyltransferase [Occultella glacieicola]TDE96018.1 ubiquinone biosynthesis protein UbiA [Occultella glacieicola]
MSSWTRTARGLRSASHPGPTAVVTVLAAAFALGVGASASRAVLVTLAVLAGQLSVGWSNDWIDAGRDAAVARGDKPVVAGTVSIGLLRRVALLALAACVVLSLATGWAAGAVHLAAVASAWSYNLVLKSTPLSWVPYAVSFGLLPIFVVMACVPGASAAPWAVIATALLGVGAHVANTLPDLEDDRRTGVRGLPHRIGRAGSSLLAPLVLMLATVVVVLGPDRPPGPGAWAGTVAALVLVLAASAGVVARIRTRSRLPFALSMAVAVVCVVLLVMAAPELVVPA